MGSVRPGWTIRIIFRRFLTLVPRRAFPHNASCRIGGAMSHRAIRITPELVLRAYRHGLFPMAETRAGDRLYWLDPERRGVLPLDGFHLSRRLRRTVAS